MTLNRLLTPTIVTGWLDCEYTLQRWMSGESGNAGLGKFAELVTLKGLDHELERLQDFERQGLRVRPEFERPEWGQSYDLPEVKMAMESEDFDLLYQVPLEHQGMRGIADFLRRREDAAPGFSRWEPVDAKLARTEGKPGHLLQLCFYASAIEEIEGAPPEFIYLSLGSKHLQPFRYSDFAPYWRRVRGHLKGALEAGPDVIEPPADRCGFCDYCNHHGECSKRWKKEDSLVRVAMISKAEREALRGMDLGTAAALAEADDEALVEVNPKLLRRKRQASLQKRTEEQGSGLPPQFTRTAPDSDDPDDRWGRGIEKLPMSDAGDVFFDIEGHPLWKSERGLVFLFGLLVKADDEWIYQRPVLWAEDEDEERSAAEQLISFIEERRSEYPDMHVYHYNHTERTVLKAIVAGSSYEDRLEELIDSGCFVDLFSDVMRNAFQVGVESYSLKEIEKVVGYRRATEIEAGSGAVLKFDEYLTNGSQELRAEIEAYNEDDVRATLGVRDWILSQRVPDDPWREATTAEKHDEWVHPSADVVDALKARTDDPQAQLLAELRHYWSREYVAYRSDKILTLEGDPADLTAADDSLAGLVITDVEIGESSSKTDKEWSVKFSFSYPDQAAAEVKDARTWHFKIGESLVTSSQVGIDLDACSGWFKVNLDEPWGEVGASLTVSDHVDTGSLLNALTDVARVHLGWDPSSPDVLVRNVWSELLGRGLPKFRSGRGLADSWVDDRVKDAGEKSLDLDGSYLFIQGPPGAGKTYTGSRIALELAKKGMTVGVASVANKTVENFTDAVLEARELDADAAAVTIGRSDSSALKGRTKESVRVWQSHDDVFSKGKKDGPHPQCAITGGTLRLFTGSTARQVGFDYLIIDEAGQVPLAEALAISACAKNVIVLGDPQQLPQVAQASHDGGSGSSIMQYLIGEGASVIDRDRGILLDKSYRMHPNVCEFVSRTFYGGQLSAADGCSKISLEPVGAGLSWLPVKHQGCSNSSEVEAEKVRDLIIELLGAEFRDRDGTQMPLEAIEDHFIVVTPYNAQKRLIRKYLEGDSRTRPLSGSVGTVNKFQGREAAVVIYSMTSSTQEDVVRGAGFLFSRERFNVAVSRAKARAYVIANEELLDGRAKSVEMMRLMSGVISFQEEAETIA